MAAVDAGEVVQLDGGIDSYYIGRNPELFRHCRTYSKKLPECNDAYGWISDSEMLLGKPITGQSTDLLERFFRVTQERIFGAWVLRGEEPECLFKYKEKDCDEILPNLLLGSVRALATANYDCVVNCTANLRRPTSVKEYIQVAWQDSPDQVLHDLRSTVLAINRWLTEGKRVLVHCEQGVSRSVACVIGYLRLCEELSYEDALRLVRSKRLIAKPNSGFVRQLQVLTMGHTQLVARADRSHAQATLEADKRDVQVFTYISCASIGETPVEDGH